MSENSTLTIHTQLQPDFPAMPVEVKNQRHSGRRRRATPSDPALPGHLPRRGRFWNVKPIVSASEVAQTASPQPPSQREVAEGRGESGKPLRRRSRATKPRPTLPDRLLRNSAIACAVLLGVLALGNVRQPWAQKAREGIRQALTMRIDLDDSLGELTFVRNLMPESALVFLNVSGGGQLSRPMDAAVAHRWSALQPWTLFEGAGEAVRSVGAGTVTAISPLSGGLFGVLVDHGEGLESVYANLAEVSVQQGDAVNRGDALGTSDEGTYFELREGGESVDPSERLGL